MDTLKTIIYLATAGKRQMNNQKDTQKTSLNIYGQSDVSNDKALVNSPVYEFANKKTEKLVTALYMVSDCMDTDDALKGKLRLLGVELLSDMYKLATLSPMDKHLHITISLAHINEILSFIEIAYTIGFISEMNTIILKKEFSNLATDLKSNQMKDKHFTFTLDEKMFNVPERGESKDLAQNNGEQADKRTQLNTMSFINNKSPLSTFQTKKTLHLSTNSTEREDRSNKIISLVKEKKDISIKDISLAFTDCSEKTIQRELNSLVLKGKIKKTGAKRWSRYSIAESSK